MRVFGPVRVEAEGFPQRRHRFMSSGQVLGELETSLFSRESAFRQADGQQFVIRPSFAAFWSCPSPSCEAPSWPRATFLVLPPGRSFRK